MGSKTKTTSNQTSNGTTALTQTPTNPAWVSSGLAQLGGAATKLASTDPYSFVAGPDALQTQAAQQASTLAPSQNYGQATNLYGSVGSAAAPQAGFTSLLNNLSSYMNPYTNNVVNTTLAGFDQNAGRQQAQDLLTRGRDATFGGSGGAIMQALDNQNIARDRAQTEAQLRDQAFNTGAGLSSQDAAQQNQIAQTNAQLASQTQAQRIAAAAGLTNTGQAHDASQMSQLSAQTQIGSILQQLAQVRAGAPISSLAGASSIFNSLPTGLLHGQNSNGTTHEVTNGTSTTTKSDPMGTIGSLGMGLGSLLAAPLTGGATVGAMLSRGLGGMFSGGNNFAPGGG